MLPGPPPCPRAGARGRWRSLVTLPGRPEAAAYIPARPLAARGTTKTRLPHKGHFSASLHGARVPQAHPEISEMTAGAPRGSRYLQSVREPPVVLASDHIARLRHHLHVTPARLIPGARYQCKKTLGAGVPCRCLAESAESTLLSFTHLAPRTA